MMDTDKNTHFRKCFWYTTLKKKNDIFKIETNDKEGIDKIAVHNKNKPK